MGKIIHIDEEILKDTIENVVIASDLVPLDLVRIKRGTRWIAESVIKAIYIMEEEQENHRGM